MDAPGKRMLKVGIFIAPAEGAGGRTPRWQDLVLMAQRAEELGFDSLWLNDHQLFQFAGQAGPTG